MMTRRPIAVALAGALVVSGLALSAQSATAASAAVSPHLAVSGLVPGASFTTLTDLGAAGSRTFYYEPSELYSPAPMLTPTIFVFADAGYATDVEAFQSLTDLGLIERAEAEHAVLMVLNPLGAEWDAPDTAVYQAAQSYIYGANTAASGKPALSFYRLNYLVGEGAGATFINQYMTQAPYVNRIAGIATFGGTMPSVNPGSALPAYIGGGTAAAVNYYKHVNDVDVHSDESTSTTDITFNETNPAKQVVVSSSTSASFTKAGLDEAYETVFRYTCRQALSTTVFRDNATTTEDFTLMQRPNLEDLDLTQNLVQGADTGTTGQTRWYEWIPDEVLEGQSAGSTKTYPLVIDLHGGGDHEIFEAESNGWIEVAGEEKVIVVAPFDEATTPVMNMVEVIKAKYPVDLSRIYLTGFSRGAANTWIIINAYPDAFAAVAPMSNGGGGAANSTGLEALKDQIDLPLFQSVNSVEYAAVDQTQTPPRVKAPSLSALNAIMTLNNIAIPPLAAVPWTTNDFVSYPLWGFPADDERDIATQWGFPITTSTLSNDAGIPLMELAIGQGLEHTHYMPLGGVAWDFLSKFSRDPETKQTGYRVTNVDLTVKGRSATAEVTAVASQGVEPTGTVQFAVDGVPVGTPQPLRHGVARIAIPGNLGHGELTATYSGDALYNLSVASGAI